MRLKTFLLRNYLPALLFMLPATTANAAISIGTSQTETANSTHEYQTDYAQWIVANLSDPIVPAPIEITTNSSSGYWSQTLTFANGSPTLTTGDTFDLQELLVYTGGNLALVSWSQQIITPGWEWVNGSIFDSDTSSELAGLNVQAGTNVLNFTFDPLSNGSSLIVAAQLKYTGPGGPASSLTLQTVPEPASAALGLLGTIFLLRRRRIN